MNAKTSKKVVPLTKSARKKTTVTAEDVREELKNFLVDTSRMMRAARKEMRLKHPSLLG